MTGYVNKKRAAVREKTEAVRRPDAAVAVNAVNTVNSDISGDFDRLSGTKVQLPKAMEMRMQERFGVRLNGLKVFADEGLNELGQRGYARGNEIHIAKEDYDPYSESGQSLLLHEAAHVVQQGMGAVRGSGFVDNPTLEAQADLGVSPGQGEFSMPTSAAGAPAQGFPFFRKKPKANGVPLVRDIPSVRDVPSVRGSPSVQEEDPERDAAAEKKGFFGGLTRRLANPFRYIGDKLLGLKHATSGFAMKHGAEKFADEKTAEPGDLGDAFKYNTETPDKGSKVESAKSTLAPLASLGASIAGPITKTLPDSIMSSAKAPLEVASKVGLKVAASKVVPSALRNGILEHGIPNVVGMEGMIDNFTKGATFAKIGAGFSAAGEGFSGVGGAIDTAASLAKANTSRKGGNVLGTGTSLLQAGADLAGAGKGAAKMVGSISQGAAQAAKGIVPGLDIVGGVAQGAKGIAEFASGKRTQENMTEQIGKLGSKEDPKLFSGKQRISMLRSLQTAREMGAINKEMGVWDGASGALKVAGSAATLATGATGIGGMAGTGLSLAGTAVGVVGGMNKSMQVEDMRSRLVEQELGLNKRIKDFETELSTRGEGDKIGKMDRATKERVVLKRLGYDSGTKKEVFMNIAMNRSKMLTDMANDASHKNLVTKSNPEAKGVNKYNWTGKEEERKRYEQRKFARQTLAGMGLIKSKSGNNPSVYSQQGVGEKLGMDEGIDINFQLSDASEATREKIVPDEEKGSSKTTPVPSPSQEMTPLTTEGIFSSEYGSVGEESVEELMKKKRLFSA